LAPSPGISARASGAPSTSASPAPKPASTPPKAKKPGETADPDADEDTGTLFVASDPSTCDPFAEFGL
jgi:hypothetical protein